MQLQKLLLRSFAVGTALLLLSATAANAALIRSYDFNGDLSDTLGNGPNLQSFGGIIGGGRYNFSPNQGLRSFPALPSNTDYGIEIRLRVDSIVDPDGYSKIIDFGGRTSDFGLYRYFDGLDFWTVGPEVAAGMVPLGQDFTVGLARSGDMIELFLNGISLFSATDFGQAVSPINQLYFFMDDSTTSFREAFFGSADFIRIHNDSSTFGTAPQPPNAIPVPAAVWLFGTALVGLLGFNRRRQKHAS